MNKYRIRMAGLGADCYVFPVSKKQFKALKDAKVDDQNNEMDTSDILKMINVGHISESRGGPAGLYVNHENIFIEIEDEFENEIMVLHDNWKIKYYDKEKDFKKLYKTKNRYLFIEDCMKGGFQVYDIKIKGAFEPNKLTVIVSDVGGKMKLITGVRYDGRKLKETEFEGGWGKGMYVHLR